MIYNTDKAIAQPTNAASRELRQRLLWVVGIRWSVAAALLLVALLGYTFGGASVSSSLVHALLGAVVAGYNLLFLFALVRRDEEQGGKLSNFIRYVQVPIDLLLFTLIVHYSGGVTGPVFVLYFLYIFVGLAVLPPVGAYMVAATAAACYGALALIEAFWIKAPVPASSELASVGNPNTTYAGYFLTVAATLMITAYIANYFAGLLTRDERTIRSQLDEINSLYTFTRETSSTLTGEDVVHTLVTAARDLENADASSLMMFNDRGEGVFADSQGLPAPYDEPRGKPVPSDPNLVRALLADGRGVYAPRVDALPGLRAVLIRPTTQSFYAIPMHHDDRVIGTLNLSFDRPHMMSQARWNLLSAMTQQAALAVERTRLFADAQRSAREMAGLYHIGLATTSSLQIDEVLHLIYEQVNRVLHPDTFYIALYDEDRSELTFDIFIEAGQPLPPFRARLDSMGVTSWVIRNRKPIYVRNWNDEIEQLPFEASVVGAPTQSVISVPLIAKNKTVGVMSVQAVEAQRFDQNHLRLLTSIAGQAALALENAKLHATVFEQAQRDPLTGAYNHGTFIDKLHVAIRAAQSEKEAVALIMLDIDRFKQYNDTYGHLVGDDVLRSTVAAIQNHLKSSDVVGRWGGEEFGIILPSVTRAQARLVADRIRQTVALNVMKDLHNRSIPSPTVNQGIAMFPEDAVNIEELIDKADSALFRAKDMGRNQIAEWIEMSDRVSPLQL